MNAEDYIRKQIQKILAEGEEDKTAKPEGDKPKTKATQKKKPRGRLIAKYGAGRHSAAVKGSKARVENDPAGLLGDLGAEMGDGDTPEKILGLVRSAIYGTAEMTAAYVGANLRKGKDGKSVIQISTKVIKPRDGVYFMSHILQAAERTGALSNLDQDITVALSGDGVSITFG